MPRLLLIPLLSLRSRLARPLRTRRNLPKAPHRRQLRTRRRSSKARLALQNTAWRARSGEPSGPVSFQGVFAEQDDKNLR